MLIEAVLQPGEKNAILDDESEMSFLKFSNGVALIDLGSKEINSSKRIILRT
jgi:hypothetical protein